MLLYVNNMFIDFYFFETRNVAVEIFHEKQQQQQKTNSWQQHQQQQNTNK